MAFKSTFNLPTLDFLLKGVKGNGKTMGLTDGTSKAGLVYSLQALGHLSATTGNYDTVVHTTQSGNSLLTGSIGLTTEAEKSGIEAEIESNIKYMIKF